MNSEKINKTPKEPVAPVTKEDNTGASERQVIRDLTSEVKSLKEQLLNSNIEKRYLDEAIIGLNKTVSERDDTIDKLKGQLNEIKNELSQVKVDKNTELAQKKAEKNKFDIELAQVKAEYNNLKVIEKRRVEELNNVLFAYGAFVKIVQGAVETHSFLNEKLIIDITKEE